MILPLILGAFVMPLSLFAFMNFPHSVDVISFRTKIIGWASAAIILFLLAVVPHGFYVSVIIIEELPFPLVGPLFWLYMLYYVLYFFFAFRSLYITFRNSTERLRA